MADPQLPAWADQAELAAAFVLAEPPELDPDPPVYSANSLRRARRLACALLRSDTAPGEFVVLAREYGRVVEQRRERLAADVVPLDQLRERAGYCVRSARAHEEGDVI